MNTRTKKIPVEAEAESMGFTSEAARILGAFARQTTTDSNSSMKSVINVPHVTKIQFFEFANGSTAVAPKEVDATGYITTEAIAKLAKKHCRLGSRGVEAAYDENADLTPALTGCIYVGGFRRVGRFRVIDPNAKK
jgi:hypothetical protein